MTDRIYNGWSNYATWRINLELFDGAEASDFGSTEAYELSLILKSYVQDIMEDLAKGVALEYALAFIDEANYYEIAEHLIEYEEGETDARTSNAGID
jgi:hypothetical protein